MFKLRAGTPEDVNFIVHAWLKRLRDSIHPRIITDRVYFEEMHKVIVKILQKPATQVVVAVSPTDDSHIFGYIVAEEIASNWLIYHWIYVKGSLRRYKVATALINAVQKPEHTIVHMSVKTRPAEWLTKDRQVIFNPFYIWSIL